MRRQIILIALLLSLVGVAFALLNYTGQDDTLTGWGACGPCAGGTGTATSIAHTINNTSPSLDGFSSRFSFTAPSLSPGSTTNVLWYDKVGANNSYTYFQGAYHIYLPSITAVQALEFDQFLFAAGQRYMMGSECDSPTLAGGKWRIWNQLTNSWVSTTASCTLLTTSGQWHTIQWGTHRVVGDTSCAGQPCMYYDSLIVDGVQSGPFTPQPSAPSADPDNVGFQVQGDMGSTGGSFVMYGDQFTLTIDTKPLVPACMGVTFTGGTSSIGGISVPCI